MAELYVVLLFALGAAYTLMFCVIAWLAYQHPEMPLLGMGVPEPIPPPHPRDWKPVDG
jgi:hypothetical protein